MELLQSKFDFDVSRTGKVSSTGGTKDTEDEEFTALGEGAGIRVGISHHRIIFCIHRFCYDRSSSLGWED